MRPIWTRVFLLGLISLMTACDSVVGATYCTDELRPTLIVEVRDSTTGAPAARGFTGVAEHESGVSTELAAVDELRLQGNWRRELPGRHNIHLRKPGYQTEFLQVSVAEGDCHVDTETVQADISVDPRAVRLDPVGFTEGPEIDAWPASAGVQVIGDTAEISGFARTNCRELRAVAYRLGIGWHVQIEPSDVALAECSGNGARQFSVNYIVPPETSVLLVTNGFGFPVDLFDGQVRTD